MEVLLLKDIVGVGLTGQVKKVSEGYARNFLFPKRFAKVAGSKEIEEFKKTVKKADYDNSVAGSRLAALSQKIKNMHITLAKKVHDEDRLYGSVNAEEILELLREKEIVINKKQIEFNKTIRTIGEHKVNIKLSSKVRPDLTLKVVAAKK